MADILDAVDLVKFCSRRNAFAARLADAVVRSSVIRRELGSDLAPSAKLFEGKIKRSYMLPILLATSP
jgi:hypothetical protein